MYFKPRENLQKYKQDIYKAHDQSYITCHVILIKN